MADERAGKRSDSVVADRPAIRRRGSLTMWPWEHVAVGYLCYSLLSRAAGREPPSDATAAIVILGSLLPDLVDKPLSWELRVFPSGYAVGHSLVFAVPVGVAALAVARRTDRPDLGVALAVGYWAHLAGDVLAPIRHGYGPSLERILWPFVTQEPYEAQLGLARGVVYLTRWLGSLTSPEVLVGYVLAVVPGLALWVADGTPGVRWIVRPARDGLGRLLQPEE